MSVVAMKTSYNGSGSGRTVKGTDSRPLPPEPTTCLPGTSGKIKIMEQRLAAGYHIHHPDDAGREWMLYRAYERLGLDMMDPPPFAIFFGPRG